MLSKNYRNDGEWTQFGGDIYGSSNYDYNGSSVAINKTGHTIAVSSYGENGDYADSGVVRVYKLNNSSPPQWTV